MACASYPRSPKARQTVQSDYTSATAKRCSAKPDRGTANAYKTGFENAAVELLTDRLVRLDIASGTLTLLPAGTELLSKLDKAA